MPTHAHRPRGFYVLGYLGTIPFFLVHLACFAAIWTGVSWWSVGLAVGLYYLRMFGVTAGYHRYFSHRSFKTSRLGQFLLALLATSSSQKGVLWWAAHHRHHHRTSDTDADRHAPKHGFLHAHVGWILDPDNDGTDYATIPDFARYPELRFLNTAHLLAPFALGVACYAFGAWMGNAWEGLVVGFCWSTVALWHGTFTINSLTHLWGRRVYPTSDDSRNSLLLALVTCGEGWHNNHHYYQAAARQGFRWWEIDLTWYVLRALAAVGLVHDLKQPPRRVLELGRARTVPSPEAVTAGRERAARKPDDAVEPLAASA